MLHLWYNFNKKQMESKYTVTAKIKKPFIPFPPHTKEFMNKVNERASGTHAKYVGVIDDLFYDYYLNCLELEIEMNIESWKAFHTKKIDIEAGKKAIKNKLKEMKEAINKITDQMIEEWYEFFLFNQTFYGKHKEFLIKEYFESLGLTVEMKRPVIGENKIDIVVGNLNIQVKPYDSRNPSMNRPMAENIIYIYYKKSDTEISFLWDSDVLDNLINERSS